MIQINYTQEQLLSLYKKADKSAQKILKDKNLGPVIQIIGKKNNLTSTQSLDIEDEVIHVLLNISKKDDFEHNLINKLNIPEKTARTIYNEIDYNIFSKIDKPVPEPDSNNNNTKKEIKDGKITAKKKLAIEELSKPIPAPTPPKQQVPQPNTIQKKENTQPQSKPTTPPVKFKTQITNTQHPEKTIVGAEKIGVDIPVKPVAKEHQFEEKLRNAFDPQKTQDNTLPNINEQKQKTIQDPYREPLE